MDTDRQKELMNEMLDYLKRDKYSIRYFKDYEKITLTYLREPSILMKRIVVWNHKSEVKSDTEKEKAMGGHNGDAIFNALKKETIETIEKKVLKDAVRQELLNNGIDYEDLEV